jgi:hypothetical protein
MLTADDLRHRLGWPGVDEETNPEYGLVYLNVRPTRPGLPPIYVCLDEDRETVVQFGFGEWHYHPEEIAEAAEMARQLVRGE